MNGPLVERLKNWNIERMIRGFDEEDLDFYMEVRLYIYLKFQVVYCLLFYKECLCTIIYLGIS